MCNPSFHSQNAQHMQTAYLIWQLQNCKQTAQWTHLKTEQQPNIAYNSDQFFSHHISAKIHIVSFRVQFAKHRLHKHEPLKERTCA